MASLPSKPWKAEYAKSGRSSCRTCKENIAKEAFRLGKMVQSSQFDGLMPMWHHAGCIMKKANQIKSFDDVEGIEAVRWDDQQTIRKYIESGGPSKTTSARSSSSESGIEVSKTSRATCKRCSEKIMKGDVRVSVKPEGQGARGVAWHHVNCFLELFPSTQVKELSGWSSLSDSDQAVVLDLVKKVPSNGKTVETQEDKEVPQSTTKGGNKRKANVDPESKNVKAGRGASGKSANNLGEEHKEGLALESKLEAQSKELWALKDDLKNHVSTSALREMLETNAQDSTGSEIDLRDRCADGMLFGALDRCPICSGSLRYSGGMYRCQGYLSEWSKCSYSTAEPKRLKGKWEIPVETSNEYLSKWFKSQKAKKPIRILPPPSSIVQSGSKSALGSSQSSNGEKLGNLRVAMAGMPKDSIEEWKCKILEAGGIVHAKVKTDTNCLVMKEILDNEHTEMKKARRMKVPVVREEYLVDCFEKQRKLPFNKYRIEAMGEASSVSVVKVKGRSAVHESSGLQDSGHILEIGKSIYNTTLNMSDLSTGVNSYYILQIIEEDRGSGCYVFRKWGRIGSERIGNSKIEQMLKSDAIAEFKRLFLEKTGNPWEAWEQQQTIQKQPGRFYPLEIDYGVKEQISKKSSNSTKSQLAPPLIELMKMLFDVDTYRTAMMEFEINMSEMPLGKLSKSNIQKGFEALTLIQNILSSSAHDPSVKDSLIIDASNRFFTVIPSIHPHVIRDEDDFKSKVKMLDALQDIEVASKIVGFNGDNDDSLDDKYKKLHCDMTPLLHDSEDYRLIEKYLLNTHAPTHKDWTLELEEVFSLEREGEIDKYAPYREKLKNRMLLWHGSRLTNFVGILSQGLRIAPPEAPTTGYMFGKGVYFADLVSKSAQYCYTDRNNPVGLMLLSEVALGEIYELKKAKYIEKPPRGKHSTKGLGKNIPQESEYMKWKDDITIPCGKPVASNVKASELMYNEYIVYDTSQVKMQFLLKVKFHHTR